MTFLFRTVTQFVLSTFVLVVLTACGGGGDTPPPLVTTYAIGGTVSGLDTGQSVVLQNNGGDPLTVSGNVAFTFSTRVASGEGYAVTVPASTGTACTVTGGSGTASHDVTSVSVVCVTAVSIGVSVSGLVGQGLTLELITRGNPGVTPDVLQELAISGNGHFVFPTPVPSGHDNIGYSYLLHVKQQPVTPVQSCGASARYVAPVGTTVPDVRIACAEFVYVAHASDNTLSAFSIDATTGTIASSGLPKETGLSPSAIASTSDKAHMYVVNSTSNDVSAFTVDAFTGELTTVPGSPFAAGARPRALSAFGTYLVLYLYVANAGSNNLSAYAIDRTTGVLSPLSPALYATGSAPSAIIIDQSTSSTTGNFVYTANVGGSDDISAFQMDFETGALTPIAGSPFHSASNATSLALGTSSAASGGFLYSANAVGSSADIYGFSVDPSSGVLTSLAGFPFQLPLCNYIITDHTGSRLYATAGTNVFGFGIDPQTGALSPLPGLPVAMGVDADSMSIDPANQFLYVTNATAGSVAGFKLNATTGPLTPMPGSPFTVGTSADFITTF